MERIEWWIANGRRLRPPMVSIISIIRRAAKVFIFAGVFSVGNCALMAKTRIFVSRSSYWVLEGYYCFISCEEGRRCGCARRSFPFFVDEPLAQQGQPKRQENGQEIPDRERRRNGMVLLCLILWYR